MIVNYNNQQSMIQIIPVITLTGGYSFHTGTSCRLFVPALCTGSSNRHFARTEFLQIKSIIKILIILYCNLVYM